MGQRRDYLVSLAIALVVTVVFLAETMTAWPHPFRLHTFQLERDNPFAGLRHVSEKSLTLNSASH